MNKNRSEIASNFWFFMGLLGGIVVCISLHASAYVYLGSVALLGLGFWGGRLAGYDYAIKKYNAVDKK